MKAHVKTLLEKRTRKLSDHNVVTRGRKYVLCWLMQALRAQENPVIDAAIALGNERGLPVVVVQTLENRYPYASHRIHRFMLEASRELEKDVKKRGLRFVRWVRTSPDMSPAASGAVDIVTALAEDAAAVFVDDVPLFVTKVYAGQLAERSKRAVFAVDACCLVPMNSFENLLSTTPAFRKAHTLLRLVNIETDVEQTSDFAPYEEELPIDQTKSSLLAPSRIDGFIRKTHVDLSLPPAPNFLGHRSAALERLSFTVEQIAPRYKWTRNNPAIDGTSRLSPWMHFGVLSPREVALKVLAAEEAGDLHSAARWKFLDETLTWREYHYHQARHRPDFTNWHGLPEWARMTLLKHADDARPQLFDLEALVHGETTDPVWNAAQRQFLLDGWMHNNLRMYWVKQLIKWTERPEEAFAVACYLNDRLSLDGRDPATYGGIRWGFGDSRPHSEQLVYGTIPRKTSSALVKRKGVIEWLEKMNGRELIRVAVTDDEMLSRYL